MISAGGLKITAKPTIAFSLLRVVRVTVLPLFNLTSLV
jgi:hypothetical protein